MANNESVIPPTEPGSVEKSAVLRRAAASFYDESPIPVDPLGDDVDLVFNLMFERLLTPLTRGGTAGVMNRARYRRHASTARHPSTRIHAQYGSTPTEPLTHPHS